MTTSGFSDIIEKWLVCWRSARTLLWTLHSIDTDFKAWPLTFCEPSALGLGIQTLAAYLQVNDHVISLLKVLDHLWPGQLEWLQVLVFLVLVWNFPFLPLPPTRVGTCSFALLFRITPKQQFGLKSAQIQRAKPAGNKLRLPHRGLQHYLSTNYLQESSPEGRLTVACHKSLLCRR